MRTSRRKTPPALHIRAARERRRAREFKINALRRLYSLANTARYEIMQIELRFRKHYKGPYAHV